jgi:hypothetical protein
MLSPSRDEGQTSLWGKDDALTYPHNRQLEIARDTTAKRQSRRAHHKRHGMSDEWLKQMSAENWTDNRALRRI